MHSSLGFEREPPCEAISSSELCFCLFNNLTWTSGIPALLFTEGAAVDAHATPTAAADDYDLFF